MEKIKWNSIRKAVLVCAFIVISSVSTISVRAADRTVYQGVDYKDVRYD